MDADKPNAKVESTATGSTDHVERRAGEIAKKEGREVASDDDRKRAMAEQKATAQPNAGAEGASH